MKKQTLSSRVLAFLKGGDEAKLARFEGKLDNYFQKQVKMKTDAIATLQDKILDATEELNDTVLSVDVDRINKVEGAENYCSVYVRGVKAKLDVVDSFNAEIKELEEQIETLNKLQGVIYSVEETK